MATRIFLGLAWWLLGSLALPPLRLWRVLPPDSHMLEQVFRALHQDDAVEWRVFTHHAAGAIPAHHKLQ